MPRIAGERPEVPCPAGGLRPRRGADPRPDRRPVDLVPLAGPCPCSAETHRVTAYDLRGHGYSDAPADGLHVARPCPRPGRPARRPGDRPGAAGRAQLRGRDRRARGRDRAGAGRGAGALRSLLPGLRHLEDVSRWGHWQNFRQEAEDAGVILSSDTWYDLTTFFDQVLHLDDERLLRFRQAVGLPGLKRVLRLAGRPAATTPSWPPG